MYNNTVYKIKLRRSTKNLSDEQRLEYLQQLATKAGPDVGAWMLPMENDVEHVYKVHDTIIKKVTAETKPPESVQQFAITSMNELPDTMIGHIASFLMQKDYIQYSLCNRNMFIGCNFPNALLLLDLQQTRFPVNIGRYKNVEMIKLRFSQIATLCSKRCTGGMDVNLPIKALVLNGEINENLNTYHLEMQKIIDLSHVKILKLSFWTRHTGTRAPLFTFKTFIHLWKLLPSLKKLYINNNVAMSFRKELLRRSLKTLFIRGHQGILLELLLAASHGTLKHLRFEDRGLRLPIFTFNELQQLDILNATTHTVKNIVNNAHNLEKIHLIFDSEEPSKEWQSIMTKIVSLPKMQEIEVICHNFIYSEILHQGIIDGLKAVKTLLMKSGEEKRLKIFINFSKRCKLYGLNSIKASQRLHIKNIFELMLEIKKQYFSSQLQVFIRCNCFELKEDPAQEAAIAYNHVRKNEAFCKSCDCYSKENDDKLLTCNACPSSYHVGCLKSPPSAEYYKNVVWYCPSCAPDYQRIPLKFQNQDKYPQTDEPLLSHLELFLKKHPYLQRDFQPDVHEPLFSMQRVPLKNVYYIGQDMQMQPHDHYMSLKWGRNFE